MVYGGWVVSGVIAAPVGEGGSKLNKCWVSKYTLLLSECVAYRAMLQGLGCSKPNSWTT